MELRRSADFREAVLRAKALAIIFDRGEITPALLRAGFMMLLREGAKLEDQRIAQRRDAIEASCGKFSPPEDLDLGKAEAVKMSISKGLIKMIAIHSDSTLDLVEELLIDTTGLEESSSDDFINVVLRASACVRQKGLQIELDGAILGAAAYFAYLSGDYVDRPGIAIHVALSRSALEALIDQQGWKAESFKVDGGPPLQVSEVTTRRIERASTGKVLAVIDMAARLGSIVEEQRVTSYHEAGHAVASFILRPQVPISQVSIVEAADFAGRTVVDLHSSYMQQRYSTKFFREELQILLAGGVAQQILGGGDSLDEGARSDIERATQAAWEWVACLGLDECFGPIALPVLTNMPGYQSGCLSNEAQLRVQSLLKTAIEQVRQLLDANWHLVELMASALIEKKVLNTHEVVEIFVDRGLIKWPGIYSVRSKMVTRFVEFAQTSGICETSEGPVRFEIGDALVTGVEAEQWPIARAIFDLIYVPAEGVNNGDDGEYQKLPKDALALPLTTVRTIALKDGGGILSGRPGDWLIDYGNGDMSIVKGALFEAYYEVVL